MRINNNIAALNAWRGLTQTDGALSKSLEKLSSGLRINRAGDDAAGLAISEKMRAQIKGLNMASKNAQDGISLIQTAEGALNETHSILQRMRELAVQSASDTNSDSDRAELQKEVDQLVSEITRISTTTEFNTKKLLNGDLGIKINSTGNTAELKQLVATGTSMADGAYTITMTAAGTDTVTQNSNSIASGAAGTEYTLHAGSEIDYGTYTLRATNKTATDVRLELYSSDGILVKAQDGVALNANLSDFGGFDLNFSGAGDAIDAEGTLVLTVNNITANITVTKPDASTTATGVIATGLAAIGGKISIGGFEFKLQTNHGATTTTNTLTLTNKAAVFQIGANASQTTSLSIGDMSSSVLGVDVVTVATKIGAEAAITTISTALDKVSAERSKLGAMQNRLEHTINNLGTASENLTAAESRIRDVDMAAEMMEFTKKNILAQAGTAMLAQANQRPQSVLQLLQ